MNIFDCEQHRLFGLQRASTLEAARAFRNRRGTQLDVSARSKTPNNHFERFLNDCQKINFELITPTYCNSYYNRSKQGTEPIGIPIYYLSLAQSAGKIARTAQGANCFGFGSHWLKTWREILKQISKRSNRIKSFSDVLVLLLNQPNRVI